MKFIADGDSYASLKSPGNQLFHKALFPDLLPPNKNIIKNGCHNLWKEVLKPKLKEYFAEEASGEFDLVSTLDIWTDDSNQSYIGVTAHFINRNWELEVFSIALRRILNHHTAENIALWIKEIYIDWAINPWLRINDGGSNVSAALSEKISALNNLMSSFLLGALPINYMVQVKNFLSSQN